MKIIYRTLHAILICLAAFLHQGLEAQPPQDRILRTYHVIAVQPGETLFGLSRNFNVPVDEIRKANPSLAQDSILRVGREIMIPVIPPVADKPATAQPEKPVQGPARQPFTSNPFDKPQPANNTPASPAKPEAAPTVVTTERAPDGYIHHIVGEKQTLFAISRMYNVPIEDIMAWNKLADNNIKMGMKLLIKSPNGTAAPPPTVSQPADTWSADSIKKETSAPPRNSLQESLHQNFLDAKARGGAPVSERVSIGWVASENPKMSGSYFCLHKNAPAGTIIKLTNLVNKKVAFVKVIGKLPETAENINVMMRVSSSVKTDLLLGGEKAYVEMEYYP